MSLKMISRNAESPVVRPEPAAVQRELRELLQGKVKQYPLRVHFDLSGMTQRSAI
jgi:hypothetical protein